MTTLLEVGDKVKGQNIVCESRQVKGPTVINKSGRHKAQRTILKDNAECTIIKRFKWGK